MENDDFVMSCCDRLFVLAYDILNYELHGAIHGGLNASFDFA